MSPYEKEAFQHCPVCGAKVITKSNIQKDCINCGYIYFIAPKPSAGAIIINGENEILLIKRKRNPLKDTWDIPAGFCDDGENLEDALVREIKEEVGLDIKNYKFFKSFLGDYEFKGVIKKFLHASFIIKIDKDDVINVGDDASESKFVKPEDINFDEIGFVEIRNLLKDYIKTL